MDEEQVESLRMTLGIKESIISQYKTDNFDQKLAIKQLDEKINQKTL